MRIGVCILSKKSCVDDLMFDLDLLTCYLFIYIYMHDGVKRGVQWVVTKANTCLFLPFVPPIARPPGICTLHERMVNQMFQINKYNVTRRCVEIWVQFCKGLVVYTRVEVSIENIWKYVGPMILFNTNAGTFVAIKHTTHWLRCTVCRSFVCTEWNRLWWMGRAVVNAFGKTRTTCKDCKRDIQKHQSERCSHKKGHLLWV